jgi:hypothetical protein
VGQRLRAARFRQRLHVGFAVVFCESNRVLRSGWQKHHAGRWSVFFAGLVDMAVARSS